MTYRGKRLATIAAAIGCIAVSVPALGFDTHATFHVPGTTLAASGTPDLSSDKSNEAAARYRVDALNYDDRWASMFGSAFPISRTVSLFADYQYDQWASRSSGSDTSLSAWENYRVTVGCTVQY